MGQRLESIVDARPPITRRLKRRIAFATGVLVGGSVVAALLVTELANRPTDLVVIEHPIAVSVPVPVEVPAPPAPPPPADPLQCPTLPAAGEPIGKAITSQQVADLPDASDEGRLEVVASARLPVIAVRDGDKVRVSTDDGATFQRVLYGHAIVQIGVGDDGTVYARDDEHRLGSRTPDGKETWRRVAIAKHDDGDVATPCLDRFIAGGDQLLWFHDHDRIAVTTDRGATWKRISTRDQVWSSTYSKHSRVFAWDGGVYQIDHFWDMCGVDDYPVYRVDLATHAITHSIFHNYWTAQTLGKLLPDDDSATQWTWKPQCYGSGDLLHPCDDASHKRVTLLAAHQLAPRSGARSLAVHAGGLVELCPGGARQIYRTFPTTELDAVDWAGRPLLARYRAVVRWSPEHGWRRLLKLPDPAPPAAE